VAKLPLTEDLSIPVLWSCYRVISSIDQLSWYLLTSV